MDTYDAVIVGAGPGGLMCAETLAKAGRRVLVLEQKDEVGPKICAGGFTIEGQRFMNLPDSFFDLKFTHARVHTSFGSRTIRLDDYAVYTVDRKRLGQLQLKRAREAGAEVRTGCYVTDIGKDCVTVNDREKVAFRNLVGADGSYSKVRRHLGLRMDDLGFATQYIVPGDFRYLEFFFKPKLFHSWYAWIFPHKGYASIGTGCDPRIIKPANLKKNLDKWLKERKIDVSGGRLEAHPINSDYRGYHFGSVYLVGDAAGLASGLTGEGIPQALISGSEVANLIIDKGYEPAKIDGLIKAKKEEAEDLRKLKDVISRGPNIRTELYLIAIFTENKLLARLLEPKTHFSSMKFNLLTRNKI